MSSTVPAYRVTPEDLPDADHKTREGIRPLLERLNRSLTAVISAVNAIRSPTLKTTTFTTDVSGSALVDLKLDFTPTDLWVSGLMQSGAFTNTVNSISWIPISSGARILFVGLYASTEYDLRVRYM